MKKFILGKKIGMTQYFGTDGEAIPVTVVKAGPCTVVQKKTPEIDGYSALKLGFEDKKKNVNKPNMGEYTKYSISPKRYLKEFKTKEMDSYSPGQEIKVEDMFQDKDSVDVTGVSKGKGFQGVIKRFNLSRGRETHGSKYHRRTGSLGGGTSPGKVFKGKKMPGHMGFEKVTVLNLEVVKVDSEKGLLLIKGALPGPKGGLLTIRETIKGGKR